MGVAPLGLRPRRERFTSYKPVTPPGSGLRFDAAEFEGKSVDNTEQPQRGDMFIEQ